MENLGSNVNISQKDSLVEKAFNNQADKITLFVNVGQPLCTFTPTPAK